MDEVKPGIRSTESWLTALGGTGLMELAQKATAWQVQVACVLAIALMIGAYAFARAKVKAADAGGA